MRLRRLVCLIATLPAWCGEQAVLVSGFRIAAERHEVSGSRVRLITRTGSIELDAGDVLRVEADDPIAPPVPAPLAIVPPPPDTRQLVRQAVERHGLPPELVDSVARAESGFRGDALSPKGAIGVMQLMPATATELAADPFVPEQNIEAGTRLLRELLIKYQGSTQLALAAYNAGPGAVARHGGVPPFRETRLYVDRVIRDYLRRIAQKSTGSWVPE
ncbi:MAG: lytic transglycosylase domain-containing protein [Acidobacteria bacterium]|nr:lytic transglycosylase domain-containing protein [Acidobacteriota bacterium]